jgi:hypothetical protein
MIREHLTGPSYKVGLDELAAAALAPTIRAALVAMASMFMAFSPEFYRL